MYVFEGKKMGDKKKHMIILVYLIIIIASYGNGSADQQIKWIKNGCACVCLCLPHKGINLKINFNKEWQGP